jgi:type I restriction enzyme S subunit
MIQKLKDICKINMGQSPKSDSYNEMQDGLPFYQGNADFGEINPVVRYWCNKPIKTAIKKDVLLSVRAPIGAVNIATEKCCIGRGLASIREIEGKSFYKYLYYLLISKNKKLNDGGTGSTFKAITKNGLENIEILLPSLSEQQRIANELDIVSGILAKQKEQYRLFDELIKSRFVEMFGDTKTNSKKLPLVKPEEICESISAGGDRPDEVSSIKTTDFAYPIFSNGEKDDGLYGWSKEYRIEKPSVTVSGRGTIGYSSYRKDGKFTPIVRLIVMTPNEKVNPVYLTYYLNLEREEGSGSGVQQLTVPMIKSKKIMLPELIKQNKFAEFVEQVDKLKLEVQKSFNKTETLYKALMQKYFG